MSKKNYHGLDYSSEIDITEEREKLRLHLKSVGVNMQEDAMAFEAWSILLHLREKKDIILSFNPMEFKEEFYFENLSTEKQHYMRFLYRLLKFQEDMHDWFSVSKENKDVLKKFRDVFNSVKKVNNYPEQDSGFNRNKGQEHILEKAFAENALDIKGKTKPKIDCELNDQLPVGIFVDKKAKKNRIFSGGSSAIDLWGIDSKDNAFCIFELKKQKGNDKVGIISELYFYANIILDLLNNRNGFELNKAINSYRGYEKIIDFKNNHKNIKIKAYFLVKSFHSRVEELKDEIIEILNKNNSGIIYGIVNYDTNDSLNINDLVKELESIRK